MEQADSIRRYMDEYNTAYSIGSLTSTICALAGLPAPETCTAPVIDPVLDLARMRFHGDTRARRIVVFCPDAIGELLIRRQKEDFAPLDCATDFKAVSSGVMPSVTPVCFGTIFSGAPPEIHGILEYRKPVLEIQTLFDVFAHAGKNVGIVSVNECSIDKIFRARPLDYYSLCSDEAVFRTGCRLVRDDSYDLLLIYDSSYDSSLHRNCAHSAPSLDAMRASVRRFLELADCLDASAPEENRVLVFAPDHGGHDHPDGFGTHGQNLPEDMLVSHFYRLRAACTGHGVRGG